MSKASLLTTLFRLSLKLKAIRHIPDGLCRRCDGTGASELLADLGEAFSRGFELPIVECELCSGTGMALGAVEVTAIGRLLLFPVAAAKQYNRQTAAAHSQPALAGAPTSELLSLIDALHTNPSVTEETKPAIEVSSTL